MTVKISWIITGRSSFVTSSANAYRVSSINKIGSITDNWYSNLAITDPALPTLIQDYALLRASLLPDVAAVVGARVQTVGALGAAQPFRVSRSGSAGELADIPQMALSCTARSKATQAERKFVLGFIPDDIIEYGSYKANSTFQWNLNALLDFVDANLLIRAINQVNTVFELESIDEDGNLVASVDLPFNALDKVQVMRTVNEQFRKVGGIHKLATKTDAKHFKLAKWKRGACLEGVIRAHGVNFEGVTFPTWSRQSPEATTRKVGRVFGSLRGRASRRS